MTPEPSRGRAAARRRDARRYTRWPLRVNLALLGPAAAVAGLVAGWRSAVGAAVGVAVVLLIFAGGGWASAFAGRGTRGRLLAVTLAGLFARLLAAITVLWLLAVETSVAHGRSVAITTMLAVVATLATYIWTTERSRRSTTERPERAGGSPW